jgi:hypothetical protein
MSSPDQNPADVLEFFERTIPDQIHLTAIDPEKRMGVVARDFGTDAAAAQAWALQRNTAGLNVYYTINRVRDGLHGKPSKSDIVGVRFAHVDVDPPKGATTFTEEERAAVHARLLAASPGVLVWSGNGFQGLWRLAEGVATTRSRRSTAALSTRWAATQARMTSRVCSAWLARSTGRMSVSAASVACLRPRKSFSKIIASLMTPRGCLPIIP